MAIEGLRTPVGRVVWGNPKKSQIKKDQRIKQPILKDGKPVEQWAFGVAFTKPEFNQFMKPYFDQEAATGFPNGVPQGFSWKYVDGDGVDKSGKPYNQREGYGGCIVLTVSTEAFAPQVFKEVNGAFYEVAENEIKTGDYVALNLNLKLNIPTDRTHTPGLYVNPNGVVLVGQGQAIINSANPEEMFGGQHYQLPPGATPLGAAPQQQPGQMPGMGQPMQQQPQFQQPMQQPQFQQPMQQQPQQQFQQPMQQQPQQQFQQPMQQQPQQQFQQPMQNNGYPPPATDFVQGQPMQQPQQPIGGGQMPGMMPSR